MSNISPRPEQSTDDEILTLTSLSNLAISSANQFIQKTGATTFANTSITPSQWTQNTGTLYPTTITDKVLLGSSDPSKAVSQLTIVNNTSSGLVYAQTWENTISGNNINLQTNSPAGSDAFFFDINSNGNTQFSWWSNYGNASRDDDFVGFFPFNGSAYIPGIKIWGNSQVTIGSLTKIDPTNILDVTGNSYFSGNTGFGISKPLGQLEIVSNYTKVVSPIMSSNVLPYPYVASASTEYAASLAAYKAFNGSTGVWQAAAGINTGWVKLDMVSLTTVVAYKVTGYGSSVDPKSWTLQGSNTGAFAGEETILNTQTNVSAWSAGEVRTYTLAATAQYRYYRINITASFSATAVVLRQLQLIGATPAIFVKPTTGAVGINTENPTGVYTIAGSGYPYTFAVTDTNNVLINGSQKMAAGTSTSNLQVWGSAEIGNPVLGGAAYLYFNTYPTLQGADAYIKIQNYQWTFALTTGLGDGYTDLFKMDASGGFGHSSAQPVARIFNFTSKINNAGTAGYQAMVVNINEIAVGSGANLLLDLQTTNSAVVTSRFNVNNLGGFYAGSHSTFKDGANIIFGSATGTQIGSATTQKIGIWGVTPIVQPVTNAYTSNSQGSAYTGIDNLQVGSVYAQLSDLNLLRVAYDNLRASYDNLLTKLKTTGIVA